MWLRMGMLCTSDLTFKVLDTRRLVPKISVRATPEPSTEYLYRCKKFSVFDIIISFQHRD